MLALGAPFGRATPMAEEEPEAEWEEVAAPAAAPKAKVKAKAVPKAKAALPFTVGGPLPPAASHSGRRYYALRLHHRTAGFCVAAGWTLCNREWDIHTGPGSRFPVGFVDLESAVNYLLREEAATTVPVVAA